MHAGEASYDFLKALSALIADDHDPRFRQLAEHSNVVDAPIAAPENRDAYLITHGDL